MMEDDEKILRGLALRAPSAELDARVEKLLSVPRAARGSWTQQAGPWQQVGFWQCVAACAVCAAAAVGVGGVLAGGVFCGSAGRGGGVG